MVSRKRYVYEDINSSDMIYLSNAVRYCDININDLSWLLSGKVRDYLFSHIMDCDKDVFRGYKIVDDKLRKIINDIIYIVRYSRLSPSMSHAFERYFTACRYAFATICRVNRNEQEFYKKMYNLSTFLVNAVKCSRNNDIKGVYKAIYNALGTIIVLFDVNVDIIQYAESVLSDFEYLNEFPSEITWG